MDRIDLYQPRFLDLDISKTLAVRLMCYYSETYMRAADQPQLFLQNDLS